MGGERISKFYPRTPFVQLSFETIPFCKTSLALPSSVSAWYHTVLDTIQTQIHKNFLPKSIMFWKYRAQKIWDNTAVQDNLQRCPRQFTQRLHLIFPSHLEKHRCVSYCRPAFPTIRKNLQYCVGYVGNGEG